MKRVRTFSLSLFQSFQREYPRVVSRRLNNPFPWFKAGEAETEGRNLFRLARLVTQGNTFERRIHSTALSLKEEGDERTKPQRQLKRRRPEALWKKRGRKNKKEKEIEAVVRGQRGKRATLSLLSNLNHSFKISARIKAAKAFSFFEADPTLSSSPCSAFHGNRIINRTRQTVLLRPPGDHYRFITYPPRLENDWRRGEDAWNKFELELPRYLNIEMDSCCAKIWIRSPAILQYRRSFYALDSGISCVSFFSPFRRNSLQLFRKSEAFKRIYIYMYRNFTIE